MTNVFKKYGMAIVAILMVVGFSAFKVAEKFSTPENGWYPIVLLSEVEEELEEPEFQKIEIGSATNPDGTICSITHFEKPCMVNLVFPSNYSGPTDITNENLQDLISNYGVTLGSPAYARRDN